MDDILLVGLYWGKTKPKTNSGPQWHPLVYHSLDVAACRRKLLEADTERRQSLARLAGVEGEALLAWLSFLLAIYDLVDGYRTHEVYRRGCVPICFSTLDFSGLVTVTDPGNS